MKNLEAENPCTMGILVRGGGAKSTESTATMGLRAHGLRKI